MAGQVGQILSKVIQYFYGCRGGRAHPKTLTTDAHGLTESKVLQKEMEETKKTKTKPQRRDGTQRKCFPKISVRRQKRRIIWGRIMKPLMDETEKGFFPQACE